MDLYPAIDLKDGGCVRLYQGDYARQTRYDSDPAALAYTYAEAGARWLHVVDLDAARDGGSANLAAIEGMVARVGCLVQAGGGVREQADIDRLLAAGVSRVVIGSMAIRQPAVVGEWFDRYGPERLCLALDVRHREGDYRLAAAGWTEAHDMTLWAALEHYQQHRLRHVLCTDIGRDGTLEGPNLGLYRSMRAAFPEVVLQASGGVGSLEDIGAVGETGAAALIVGRALLDGRFTLEQALALVSDTRNGPC